MQITPGVHVISEMIEMMTIKSPLEVEKIFFVFSLGSLFNLNENTLCPLSRLLRVFCLFSDNFSQKPFVITSWIEGENGLKYEGA